MLNTIIKYPPLYTTISNSVAEIFSLQPLVATVPFECLHDSKKDHFYNIFILKTAGPIGVIVLGALYYAAKKCWLQTLRVDITELKDRKKQLHDVFMEAFFIITYVAFVPGRCVCLFMLWKILIQVTEYFQHI